MTNIFFKYDTLIFMNHIEKVLINFFTVEKLIKYIKKLGFIDSFLYSFIFFLLVLSLTTLVLSRFF